MQISWAQRPARSTITNVVQTNLGTYAVVVSNAFGTLDSTNAVLSDASVSGRAVRRVGYAAGVTPTP